jgi:hypothetical protein
LAKFTKINTKEKDITKVHDHLPLEKIKKERGGRLIQRKEEGNELSGCVGSIISSHYVHLPTQTRLPICQSPRVHYISPSTTTSRWEHGCSRDERYFNLMRQEKGDKTTSSGVR